VDICLHDTYFVIAHFHFVMASASLFAILGGTYYWFPKFFGRMLNETLGKIHFALTFLGIYGTFYPMHFIGLHSNDRRLYETTAYPFLSHTGPIDVFVSLSAFLLGAAQLVFVFNFFWSLRYGPAAEQNPWHSNSLEWEAPTPPPHGNWGPELPTVYRWPYDYSVPGAKEDYVPQTVQTVPVAAGAGGGEA